jgi:hypothetical protein
MIKRAISLQFVPPVLSGLKRTTIRAKAWPVGVPIMLFRWEGKPYGLRSRQIDVVPIMVTATEPIAISNADWAINYTRTGTHGPNVIGVSWGRHARLLHEWEGFATRDEMDAWFRKLVKPGQTITQHIMVFRRAAPEEV